MSKRWLPIPSWFQELLVLAVFIGFLVQCGDKNKNKDGCCGGGGEEPQEVTVNLNGASGVLVVDSGTGSKLRLAGSFEKQYGDSVDANDLASYELFSLAGESGGSSSSNSGQSGSKSLYKVKSDGGVDPVLSVKDEEEQGEGPRHGPPKMSLPPVLTIGISYHNEIYLHFQHQFIFQRPTNGMSAHEPSSGAQCQVFKVKGGNVSDLRNSTPEPDASNLECIDNEHQIDSWQSTRNSVFQFDKDSNVYYPGSLPHGGGKMVVYKRSRDGSSIKEMINSNICVNDFLVTKNGGVFYTGSSSCGPGSNGGGFFRYVSPAGSVREIARDWWNFVYEPVAGATSDKAVFFGPDPTSSTTASWDSACLFNFDPEAGSTTKESVSPLITCGNDIWSWINMTRSEDITTYGKGWHDQERSPTAAWTTEYKSRCESSGQIFAGGGSQISSIKQDSNANVYVIGKLRKKKAGQISCNIMVRGAHCVINSVPFLFDTKYDTSSECTSAGGLWTVDSGYCTDASNSNTSYTTRASCLSSSVRWHFNDKRYDGVASNLCVSTNSNKVADIYNQDVYDITGTEGTQKFQAEWLNCQVKSTGSTTTGGNNQNWLDEYTALALVNKSTKSLAMLSGTSEQASRLWLVNDVAYYSSYNNTEGKYYLKKYNKSADTTETMATNFETYNLADGSESGKLYYDGLDFSNNSYSFGHIGASSPFTREQKTGLTGTIKTIVILPK